MIDDALEPSERLRAAREIGAGEFAIISDRTGDVHRVCLFGELDIASTDGVARELERVESSDAPAIVLDLSGLTFMDSTGVRLLMSAHARSRADSNRLTLLRGRAGVQRVLELCGVDTLLPFAD